MSSPFNDVVSLQMVKDSVLNEEMRRKAQGHIQKHCFLWKNENKDKKGKSKEKNHDDDDDDDDGHVTTATGDDLVILRNFELIIDSGATLHVIPRKEFFTSYTSGDFRVLKMGNDDVSKVSDKIWFGKDVKYDHLRVFGCKAFMHVPKDERSKLDMKTRYGQDEYGYRLYDSVEKKLVKSHDVQFMEDQTIEAIDKNGKQHDYVGDQQLGDVFDVPLYDDVEEEQEMSQDENPSDAPEPPLVQLRKSNRQRQSSTRYPSDEYVTLTDGEEPECYQETMESEERQKWLDAMQDEIKSLHDDHTYELVKLPKGKKILENRLFYRVKQESNSTSPRYKARLVVEGYRQKKDVNFKEIFSPVMKMSSIRIMLSLATIFDLEVEQMDVKTTFLHGDLEEEIHMKQLDGYKKTTSDHYVFVRKFCDDDFIILLLLKKQLNESFAMKDMRVVKQILGIRIIRDRQTKKLWLSQEHYVKRELGFVQDKSKHIDVRYHWICDALDAKLLELAKVHTDDNGADMMTKALPRGKFEAETLIAGSTHIILHLNCPDLDLKLFLIDFAS
ncbi:hypothetical protein CR513_51722, partial [Mucuna pruriens]